MNENETACRIENGPRSEMFSDAERAERIHGVSIVSNRKYELGKGGKLVPVDETAGQGLPVGTVLRWGGNQGWPECDLVILQNHLDIGYWCFNRDEPDKNTRLHMIEYSSIKRNDDPALWHSQHMFLTPEIVLAAQVLEMQSEHKRQADQFQAGQDKAKQEANKLEAIGRELWPKLIPPGTTHLIIAECMQDDSDMQSDYFSSHSVHSVILAASHSSRDNFAEMRKAAVKIPETKHLGPGCGNWHICIKAGPKDESNRTWTGRLEDSEGRDRWTTEAEARAVLAVAVADDQAKNDAVPFVPFSPQVPYGADVKTDEIEHREKYSGGSGYYLQVGGCHSGGWRVKKTSVGSYQWNEATKKHEQSTAPSRETCIMLAQRYDHLMK